MNKPTLFPTHHTRKRKGIARPAKPWEGFPLYWHPRGYWMCRRNGEDWIYEADADESYRRFVLDQDALMRGSQLPQAPRRYLLKDAVNLYLTRQKRRHDDGELSDAQFAKCRHELQVELPKATRLSIPLTAFRGTSPDDRGPAHLLHSIRAKAINRGLQAAHRHIVMVRAVLNYAATKKLMLPADYGDDFDPPTQSAIDRQRRERDEATGDRAWSEAELRKIVTEAERRGVERRAKKLGNRIIKNPHLYAQVCLALFGGLGSDDLSVLKEAHLDRNRGVIRGFRAKNGRPFVFAPPKVVWNAIDNSLSARAEAADDEARPLVFRTSGGRRCNLVKRHTDEIGLLKIGRNDTIGKTFQRFIKSIGVYKPRTGFKTLRAMCRTMMVGAGIDEDIRAVIMGRRFRYSVDEYYVRGDLREKLIKASLHIEKQLFPKRTGSRRKPS